VIAAILFVATYLGIHSGSFALGGLGILLILLSFPLAMFFFTVCRINWFGSFHVLALFVVLGVGADDIFVFQDAWRHSEKLAVIRDSFESRMVVTYEHTGSAVFNTSFTTTVAFLATALSPIMPISSFGIFAAFAIIANYLLVMSFWPAAVVIWEVQMRRARCVGCCCPFVPACAIAPTSTPLQQSQTAKEDATPQSFMDLIEDGSNSELRCVERFFSKRFAPTITWATDERQRIKPVSIVLVLLMGSAGLFFSVEALQMRPPSEEEQWFPKGHMLNGLTTELQENFLTASNDVYASGGLYLGLKDLRKIDFNRWVPDRNRGDVVFDHAFNLSDPVAQNSFLGLCVSLRTAACGEKGCVRPPHTLVLPSSVSCFLEDFANAVGAPLPVGDVFTAQLQAWLQGTGRGHTKNVGWLDGRIKYVRIPFETTLLIRQPNDVVRPIYDKFVDFVDDFRATAPPTLQTCLPYVGRTFTWMVTETKLVEGVFIGFAICFPVAFAVLFSATADLKMSLFAVLTISFVVGTLLGLVKVALGWDLGTGESIAATIVLGLAVDYTVHVKRIGFKLIARSVAEGRLFTVTWLRGLPDRARAHHGRNNSGRTRTPPLHSSATSSASRRRPVVAGRLRRRPR
jgi:protein dispatched 1